MLFIHVILTGYLLKSVLFCGWQVSQIFTDEGHWSLSMRQKELSPQQFLQKSFQSSKKTERWKRELHGEEEYYQAQGETKQPENC